MSDSGAQAVITRLGAQIAQLQKQLADAQAAQRAAEARAATAAQPIAGLQAEIQRLQMTVDSGGEQHRVEISALQDQVVAKTAEVAKAESDHAALCRKFDDLYGPVEDGIIRGPAPYVTTHDNEHHLTLRDARICRLAHTAGVSRRHAEGMIDNSAAVVAALERTIEPT